MNTKELQIRYTLTDAAYRAAVRAADGPVQQAQYATYPVGALSPDAREALLDLDDLAGKLRGGSTPVALANYTTARIDIGDAPRDCAPTADEVSALCVGALAAQRVADLGGAIDSAQRAAERDARIAAQLTAFEADHAAARAARFDSTWQFDGCPPEIVARARALRKLLAAEAERERESQNERQREWVARLGAAHELPELARAASEGRDLGDRPTRLLQQVLAQRLAALSWSEHAPPIVSEFGRTEERCGVPTARAYALHDRLAALADELGCGLPGAVRIGEISRVDIHPDAEDYVWRTGVVVSCLDAEIAVLAESE